MGKYDFIIAAIALVLFLTVFFTLFAYLLGAYYWIRGRRAESTRSSLKQALEDKLAHRTPDLTTDVRSAWKRLEVALPVLFDMDDAHGADQRWHAIRETYCRKALLPIARKYAGHFNMLHRLLAAKVFSMQCEPDDEVHVLKLIRDKVPLVHMEILLAAPLVPTSNVVNSIIDMMATYRRKSYALYTETFRRMPHSAGKTVVDRLHYEDQPYVRAICYTLLMALNRTDLDLDLTRDLESEVLDLRISAIKYLARCRKGTTAQDLSEYLQDPDWQVRVVAVRELGELKTEEARRHLVASMRDPKWWVRYNAGLALKNMGEFGLEALREMDAHEDRFAYEVARYLLVGRQQGMPEGA